MIYIDWYDKITPKIVQTDKSVETKIIDYINHIYLESDQYMSPKRDIRQNWYERYLRPKSSYRWYHNNNNSFNLKMNYLHQQLKTEMAMFYDSWLTVEFDGENYSYDEKSYAISKLAEKHNTIMNKPKKDFYYTRNLGFYGVGIRMKNGYNPIKKTLDYVNVNPMGWYCDPTGSVLENSFRYHGFTSITTKDQLKYANAYNNAEYFDIDEMEEWTVTDETYQESRKTQRWLGNYYQADEVTLINWMIRINGFPYLVTTTYSKNKIYRIQQFKGITTEQRQNGELIPFPVQIGNIFPLEWDPCGVSISELIIDKQNAVNRLLHMTYNKESINSGQNVYAYNRQKVPNPHQLARRSVDTTSFVWVNGDPWGVVSPIMQTQNTTDTQNFITRLEWYLESETWLTTQQRGVAAWAGTLWQSKILQQNANLFFGLDAVMIWAWEEVFWRELRYNTIYENLKWSDEMLVKVGNGLYWQNIKIKKNDFVWPNDVTISVKSKKLEKEKNRELLAYTAQQFALMSQDPTIPNICKVFTKRYMDKLAWVEKDQIYIRNPMSADELRAKWYAQTINEWIDPENLFVPWMDLMTYWLYINTCEEWKLKTKTLLAIEQAMIEEWLQRPEEMMQENSGIANSMASQMTSNFVAQNQSDLPTNNPEPQ